MRTELKKEEQFSGFNLININKLDVEQFLSAQLPEVIILAILSNYKKEQTETILRLIINKLKTYSQSESELSKFIQQLKTLSKLRKLDELTYKISQQMPIFYDIEKDWSYNQGIIKTVVNALKIGLDYEKYLLLPDIQSIVLKKSKKNILIKKNK